MDVVSVISSKGSIKVQGETFRVMQSILQYKLSDLPAHNEDRLQRTNSLRGGNSIGGFDARNLSAR